MALTSLLVKGKKSQVIKVINNDGIILFTCKSCLNQALALENLTACQIDSQDSLNWTVSVSKMGTERAVLSRNNKRIGATKGSKDSAVVASYKAEFISDIATQTPINY